MKPTYQEGSRNSRLTQPRGLGKLQSGRKVCDDHRDDGNDIVTRAGALIHNKIHNLVGFKQRTCMVS